MKNGLEVFDFCEEDEVDEVAASKYSAKLKNPNLDDSAALKYEFLQCVAQGTTVQKQEIGNVLCVNLDAVKCDSSCDNTKAFAPPGSGREDFATQKNSTSCEQLTDFKKDNFGCGSFMSELTSFPEAPIPGKIQLNSGISNFPSNNEPVDVNSDADGSMNDGSPTSPASDSVDDGVSLRGLVSDNCVDDLEMGGVNMPVVICPDYVVYKGNCCSVSLVIFSCTGIKIKDLTACEKRGTFSFERRIDDIIDIKCQWFQRIGSAVIKLRVLSEDVIEDDDACGTAGIEELKFAVIEPNWSEKQNKITSLNEKYKAVWDIEHDEDVEMEGDISFGQRHYFHNFDEPFEDVIYPKGDSDAVSISKRDVDLLQPETFINDTIIDFYIKYLKIQIPPEEKHRFHFFNSFFFRKLADLDKDPSSISDGRAAFLRVHKWTRKVDIFGKDYIFIPVNFNLHWSLIVICHPGEVTVFKDEDMDKSEKVPCILHMDSIKGTHAGLKNLVQSYLLEEWKVRHKDALDDLSSKFLALRFMQLELPQQENSFDCGLFLLHYLELFLADAPVNFSPFRLTRSSNFLNGDWFLPSEASLKRTLIEKLIFELLENRSRELSSPVCDNEHQSNGVPEPNQDAMAVEFLSENCLPSIAHHEINSQASQGIEITLLEATSMRNLQCVNDSGLVLREFFEPGASTGSLLPEYESFGQPSSNYHLNGTTSPREEDEVTGEEFVYLPSGENGFEQISELAPQAGTISFSSRGFATEASWNPEISMHGEHNADSSPEASFYASDDSEDVGIIEHNPFAEASQGFKKRTTRQRSPSVDNIVCLTEPREEDAGRSLKERSQPRSPSADNTACVAAEPLTEDYIRGLEERTTQRRSPSADDIVSLTKPLAEDVGIREPNPFEEANRARQRSPSVDNLVCLTEPLEEAASQGLKERSQLRSPSADDTANVTAEPFTEDYRPGLEEDKNACLGQAVDSVSDLMLDTSANEGAEEANKLHVGNNENINPILCQENLTTSGRDPVLIHDTDIVEITLTRGYGGTRAVTGDDDVIYCKDPPPVDANELLNTSATEGAEDADKLHVGNNENINPTLCQENLTTSGRDPVLIHDTDIVEITLTRGYGGTRAVTGGDDVIYCKDPPLVDANELLNTSATEGAEDADKLHVGNNENINPTLCQENLTTSGRDPVLIHDTGIVEITSTRGYGGTRAVTGDDDVIYCKDPPLVDANELLNTSATEGAEDADKLHASNENINTTLFQENPTTSRPNPDQIHDTDKVEITLKRGYEMGGNMVDRDDVVICCDDDPPVDTNDELPAAKRPRLTPPSEGAGLEES